jgi:hypothetical protein
MKKWIIGILIGLGAIGVGVGTALAVKNLLPAATVTNQNVIQEFQSQSLNGIWQNGGMMGQGQFGRSEQGRGMMGQPGFKGQTQNSTGERISMDNAVSNAEAYLKNYTQSLKVTEVMEFENNFYIVVKESDTGRDAMELLVDPVSGAVSPEIGPNMMWNLKYGHMGMFTNSTTDNTLTIDEALVKAQQALKDQLQNATVNKDGVSFYGYYTFDYSIDGKVAGMLSVNGLDGQVWMHTWHGTFINEKEIVE